ncbi:MAG: hypothetical protein LUC16_00730 [Coprobacillus sp.]|nr:hypothetical protein [Coprobacillus sp.]
MKNFLVYFTILFSLGGCFSESSVDEREVVYQYRDVEYLMINWEDILSYPGEYHAYVYSKSCGACQSLKQDILDYAINKAKTTIYFVCYQKNSIPMIHNADLSKTIGMTDADELYIGGTPTLFGVVDNSISFYVEGVKAIKKELEIK